MTMQNILLWDCPCNFSVLMTLGHLVGMGPHRALQNSDIIECILQHFATRAPAADVDSAMDGNTVLLADMAAQKDWNSLLMCTRVSRVFSGPAYRLLWRELPSLIPLLRTCIPLDAKHRIYNWVSQLAICTLSILTSQNSRSKLST